MTTIKTLLAITNGPAASGRPHNVVAEVRDAHNAELARAVGGADVVVLDGLRPQPHPSHMTIAEATAVALEIEASLRVVDASVMPTITSGNTNSPVLMLAERAAELLIQADKKASGKS